MTKKIFALSLLLITPLSFSQEPSSYVNEAGRDIKALSKNEIDAYLAGKGMGLAKAAELNNYPGPRHVLDLSKELNLSEAQINNSEQLFIKMQSKSKRLGVRLVELEKDLDQLFSSGEIDHGKLEIALSSIAKVKADIRRAHLSAHIDQKLLLNANQVVLYSQLRGYASSIEDEASHSHHH